jgi:hypothetical protein
MTGYPFDAYGPEHWTYLLALAFIWMGAIWTGRVGLPWATFFWVLSLPMSRRVRNEGEVESSGARARLSAG